MYKLKYVPLKLIILEHHLFTSSSTDIFHLRHFISDTKTENHSLNVNSN